jgi:hypothetical protein
MLKWIEPHLEDRDIERLVVVFPADSEDACAWARDSVGGLPDDFALQNYMAIDQDLYASTVRPRLARLPQNYGKEDYARLADEVTTLPDMVERLGFVFSRGVGVAGKFGCDFLQLHYARPAVKVVES